MCSGSAGQVAPARGRPSQWIRLRNSYDLPPNASSWPSSRTAGKTRLYGPEWRSGGSVALNCMMSRARRCVPTLHCGDTGSPPTVRPLSPTGPIWHEAPVRFQACGAEKRLPDARGEVFVIESQRWRSCIGAFQAPRHPDPPLREALHRLENH